MKIVKNECLGGFNLSPKGRVEYLKRKGKSAFFYTQTKYKHFDGICEYRKIKPEDADIFTHILTVDLGDVVNELKYSDDEYFTPQKLERTDPDLIAVVEELGKKAGGIFSDLVVVEIPDGIEWEIDDYDGMETIREKHRTW